MTGFFRKYKLQVDIFLILVFTVVSVMKFIEYPGAENKKMKLVSAIAFGLAAIIKAVDLVGYYRKKT